MLVSLCVVSLQALVLDLAYFPVLYAFLYFRLLVACDLTHDVHSPSCVILVDLSNEMTKIILNQRQSLLSQPTHVQLKANQRLNETRHFSSLRQGLLAKYSSGPGQVVKLRSKRRAV